MGSHRVTNHLAEAASPALTPAVVTAGRPWYSIYPPIKDERLSRPEPTQVNDLPRVATKVPAIKVKVKVPGLTTPYSNEDCRRRGKRV